ncbi:MAG: hypothetical protein RJQ08_11440 [Salinisphaeraceae bacterium]
MNRKILLAAPAALLIAAGASHAQRTSTDLQASPTTMNSGSGASMRVVTGGPNATVSCQSGELVVNAQCYIPNGNQLSVLHEYNADQRMGGAASNGRVNYTIIRNGSTESAKCNVTQGQNTGVDTLNANIRAICMAP